MHIIGIAETQIRKTTGSGVHVRRAVSLCRYDRRGSVRTHDEHSDEYSITIFQLLYSYTNAARDQAQLVAKFEVKLSEGNHKNGG